MLKVDYLSNYLFKAMTDPRDALDLTIRLYGLKAKDLAEAVGIDKSSLSRYRHKEQDIQGLTAFAILAALPSDAREFFYKLITEQKAEAPRLTESPTKYKININS